MRGVMAAKPRLTNNSVASLDEQTAMLDEIFEKDSTKQKEKAKARKRKVSKSPAKADKKRGKPPKQPASAALGAPQCQPDDLVSQQVIDASDFEMDMEDGESLTWSEAQRNEDLENVEEQSVDWGSEASHDLDYPQHGDIHGVSEDDSESVLTAPSVLSVKEDRVMAEITAKGALADFLREQLAEVKECDKVTPKLSGGVARIVEK